MTSINQNTQGPPFTLFWISDESTRFATAIALHLPVAGLEKGVIATTTGTQTVSSRTRSALGFGGWLAISFTAAAAGGFFRPDEWYANLVKPSWNPPNWVFAPVWTALYAMMGVAAWLVWQRGEFAQQRVPLTLFLVQLFLNAIWSPFFFGLHNPGLALVDIAALWMALVMTILSFWKARPVAAGLLIPYFAWITFAAVLNFAIWRLNP